MPKKDKQLGMPPALDHLVRTVSAAARHVGAFYSGKGIQDEATYGAPPACPPARPWPPPKLTPAYIPEMALRAELGCLGLQVVKNKAVEIGYTTSTGVLTTVATHYVDLFVTNPPVDQVAAVACELKVLTTARTSTGSRACGIRTSWGSPCC
jgi:hypothetical protein